MGIIPYGSLFFPKHLSHLIMYIVLDESRLLGVLGCRFLVVLGFCHYISGEDKIFMFAILFQIPATQSIRSTVS